MPGEMKLADQHSLLHFCEKKIRGGEMIKKEIKKSKRGEDRKRNREKESSAERMRNVQRERQSAVTRGKEITNGATLLLH